TASRYVSVYFRISARKHANESSRARPVRGVAALKASIFIEVRFRTIKFGGRSPSRLPISARRPTNPVENLSGSSHFSRSLSRSQDASAESPFLSASGRSRNGTRVLSIHLRRDLAARPGSRIRKK